MSVDKNTGGNRGGRHTNLKCTCVKLNIAHARELEIRLRNIFFARTMYVQNRETGGGRRPQNGKQEETHAQATDTLEWHIAAIRRMH